MDALREALDEIFGISGGGLVSDRVHDAEHVLGAMIDFAHQEVLFFLTLLAFGNVRKGADEAHGPSLAPVAFEIPNPQRSHPPAFPLPPPNPHPTIVYPLTITIDLP